MEKRYKLFTPIIFFLFFLFFLSNCGLFEPEHKQGSLRIVFANKGSESTIKKAAETLTSVEYIVKGAGQEYKGNLSEQSSSFHGKIDNLDPANDYSVLLYGRDSNNNIIGRVFQSGINVQSGKETPVSFSGWYDFVPNLVSPYNGSTTSVNKPSFEWSYVTGASTYELVVDNNSSFASPEINQTSLTTAVYTSSNSLSDGTYYWKVRCKDSLGNWGGWSETWNFTITTQGPNAPTLVSPSNGSTTNNNKPAFDWSDVSGAVMYELMVANNSNFTSPSIDQSNLTSSGYTATSSLSDGTYYWKVRCKDGLGNWGVWSGAWTFIISTTGPNPPALISPENGSSTNNNMPSFDWSDVSGFPAYELMVDNNSNFSSPEIDQTSLAVSNYAAASLSDGTYYWKVRCKDSIGNWGAWSGVWSVMIKTVGPGAPTLVSPLDGSTTNNNKPAFDWSDVSGAAVYELMVDNSSGFGSPEIDQTSLTVSNYTATASLVDGTYYWKVRCKDSIGNWGGWSNIWSFIISTSSANNIEWVFVDGGTFQMGDAFGDGDTIERPVHMVYVSNFYISKTEVTNYQYSIFLNIYGSDKIKTGEYQGYQMINEHEWGLKNINGVWKCSQGYENYPISCITWYGAYEFCKFYNYRLPTEAEWEYAARGGKKSNNYKYSGSNNYGNVTWCSSNTTQPQPVGKKQANELDLVDMSGNVWEWCADWFDSGYYSNSPTTNPQGPTSGSYRVQRGGSWYTSYNDTRVSARHRGIPQDWGQVNGIGFRCAKGDIIDPNIVVDFDGNIYKTIKIGNQVWMAENLKVTHYRNGDVIPNVTSNTEWINLTTGAYCNYNNNYNNVTTYGRLYNWYAVNDSRNIAPEGWHIPSDDEWKALEMYLGMSQTEAEATGWRGTNEGGKLKEAGISHWQSPNTSATNESGFTALPGGYHGYPDFNHFGYYAYFWSSTKSDYTGSGQPHSMGRHIGYDNSRIYRFYYYRLAGYSVRCMKD